MAGASPDGSLRDWSEIADDGWSAILVGNGLSINVSRKFDYQSVYDEAMRSQRGQPGLSVKDRAVFDAFDTTNFEAVLGKLRDAITMAEVLGRKPDPYRRRFRSVQEGLGSAVRRVHPEWDVVPDDVLAAIKAELRNYRVIFSTNYDLIVYWAIGHDDDYGLFRDCFWANGCEFDPDDCEVWGAGRPIYYMHGALHLVVRGSGITRKLTQEDGRLLDQFGQPIDGDPEARPLLVSEASPRDKLRAIEGNDYLAHAYDQLKTQDGPLLVFGHSLSNQDGHLTDAINAYPDRRVAVSMVRKSKRELRAQQAQIWGKLHAKPEDICFFNAATHPLGDKALCIDGGPLSRMRQRVGAS
jgi:uncharacterized protein DUF4917